MSELEQTGVLKNVLVSFGLGLVWGQTCATTDGITWPQSLAIAVVFPKECNGCSYLTPPYPTEVGSGGGRGASGAVDGAPMAPKIGLSSQLLSVSNEHMGKWFGWEGCLVNSLSGQ